MNENVEFDRIVQNWDGTVQGMVLKPYAKNLVYTPGHLSFTLELFGETRETEVNVTMGINEDLDDLIEGLLAWDGE